MERVLRDGLLPASILDFRPELANRCKKVVAQRQRGPRPILIFVLATKDSPPAAAVAATMSASDSNFFAAKTNGPLAAAVAATIFRVRF